MEKGQSSTTSGNRRDSWTEEERRAFLEAQKEERKQETEITNAIRLMNDPVSDITYAFKRLDYESFLYQEFAWMPFYCFLLLI